MIVEYVVLYVYTFWQEETLPTYKNEHAID